MTQGGDDFLRRWSRRKHAAARQAEAPTPPAHAQPPADPTPATQQPAAAPPPIEHLTPESDFRAFMDRRTDAATRNQALKKLFADPRFNVIDDLDIDIDDYSKLETLSEEVAAKLVHARRALLGTDAEPPAPPQGGPAESEPGPLAADPAGTVVDSTPDPAPADRPGGTKES